MVANACHETILQWCFPEAMRSAHGSSSNSRGNQMEALAWLALEADKLELIIALAFHSRKVTLEASKGTSEQ